MNLTLKEVAKLIGATGKLRIGGGWQFPVKIEDARTSWGRLDYQIVPTDPNSKDNRPLWVEASRVTLDEGAQ